MKKLFTSMFLMIAMLAMTTGIAFAQGTTTITGTVQTVVLETDPTTGETIVVVNFLDETGTPQTAKIDLQTADTLGLVDTDPLTNVATIALDAEEKIIEIDPATIENSEEDTAVENEHPVGSALSGFFTELLGVDYESIMTFHEDGVGFGVIAQALWLTNDLEGDTTTFEALLEAKQSGDYSAITLADGSTPDNWGDVVKSLKKGNNLGSVMSGKAETSSDTTNENTTIESPAIGGNTENDLNKNNSDKNNRDKSSNGNKDNNGSKGNTDNNGSKGNKGNGNGGNNGKGHGNGNGGGRP